MEPSSSRRDLPFYSSRHCAERHVCVICRDPGAGGQAYRRSLVAGGQVDATDFACPIGRPWKRPGEGDAGIVSKPDTPRQSNTDAAKAIATEQAQHPKLAICRTCPEHTDQPMFGVTLTICGRLLVDAFDASKKTCGCVMDVKARLPGAVCPLGKW